MKRIIQKANYAIATLAFTLMSLIGSTSPVFAASASLALSPASVSAVVGSSFNVGIYVNTGGNPVNAVQANLTYPAAQLDYVSVTSSSVFPIDAQSSGGGGNVNIARGAITPVSGNQLVATVRFKAKVASGTAAINFAGGSGVASSGSPILGNGATAGAAVSFKPVPPAAPAAPAPPKDTIAPTISNIKVSDVKTNAATVTWTTSEPASSQVSYGLDANYGLTALDATMVTEHKLVLDSALLRPATTYHFLVKSTDAAGNASAAGKDQTFTTAGLNVKVKVVDQQSKPVTDATVQYQKSTAKTNSSGEATLNGMPSGKLTIVVSQGGKQTPIGTEVVVAQDGAVKPITLKIDLAKKSPAKLIGILALLAALLLLVVLVIRHIGKDKQGGSGVITPLPVVPSSDPDLKPQTPSSSSSVPDEAEAAEEETIVTPTLPVKDNEPVIIRPDISTGDDDKS